MEDMQNRLNKQQGLIQIIIGILVFGSIWGLAEVRWTT